MGIISYMWTYYYYLSYTSIDLSPPCCGQKCSSQYTDISCPQPHASRSDNGKVHTMKILAWWIMIMSWLLVFSAHHCYKAHLKLSRCRLSYWERANFCPLSPFDWANQDHSSVFGPAENHTSILLVRTLHKASWYSFRQYSDVKTHGCLALALQYFLFLSGSVSWPFLQHCPHTNCILRLGGPNFFKTACSS